MACCTVLDHGQELFGYFPGAVLTKLKDLAKSPFSCVNLVDGPLTLGDAYLGGAWKTLLIAGLGAGGKSVVGLDVTNITQSSGSGTFTASNILFGKLPTQTWGTATPSPLSVEQQRATGAIWGQRLRRSYGRAVLFVYNSPQRRSRKSIPALAA